MDLNLENIVIFQLTPAEAFVNLSVALFCGVVVGVLYRMSYRGINFSSNNIIAIVMLTMITALVIMVIGNNLARAFGLVGAMSIIRFRTAVKDTQDIMFIFFALAIGLSCGAGMYIIALIGTFFIGITTWIAVLINGENLKKTTYLLQIYTTNLSQDSIILEGILSKYCSFTKLINIKTLGVESQKTTEFSYYINFKRAKNSTEFVETIKALEGVSKVNLFFDEE